MHPRHLCAHHILIRDRIVQVDGVVRLDRRGRERDVGVAQSAGGWRDERVIATIDDTGEARVERDPADTPGRVLCGAII